MGNIRVLIVDEQPLYRRGIAALLHEYSGITSCGEFSATEFLNSLEKGALPPSEVLIIGNRTAGLASLMVPRVVRMRYPNLKIIVLTQHMDDEDLGLAIDIGVVAYAYRDLDTLELIQLIRRVAADENPIVSMVLAQPQLAERLINTIRKRLVRAEGNAFAHSEAMKAGKYDVQTIHGIQGVHGAQGSGYSVGPVLTARELEVLTRAMSGTSNKGIASSLQLSPQTVRNHLTSAMRKLGVHTRTEAVLMALRRGLLTNAFRSQVFSAYNNNEVPVRMEPPQPAKTQVPVQAQPQEGAQQGAQEYFQVHAHSQA